MHKPYNLIHTSTEEVERLLRVYNEKCQKSSKFLKDFSLSKGLTLMGLLYDNNKKVRGVIK